MNPFRPLITGLVALAVFSPAATYAATYYISPSGNDALAGTSVSTAWKTTARVRSHAATAGFQAGDQILFEGGATFTSDQSTNLYFPADKSHGTAQNPIVVGSYGTGRARIQATATDGLLIWIPPTGTVGLGYVVRDLVFEGNGATNSGGNPVHGLIVWNSNSTTVSHLRVLNCDFTNFSATGFTCGRDAGKGRLTDVIVRDCRAYGNKGASGKTQPTGSGLVLAGTDGGLMERCIAYDNGANNTYSAGPVGIWTYDSNNVVIQFCESYANKTAGGDGGGFDIDGGCTNSVIQYCYSHDNYGAGYLLAQYNGAQPWNNNTVRYNISQNDGRRASYGGIMFWGYSGTYKVQNARVYNNTVFVNDLNKISGTPAAVRFNGGNVSGAKLYNNVLVSSGTGARLITGDTALSTSAAHFLGNLYWSASGPLAYKWGATTHASLAAWRTATGQENEGGVFRGLETAPQLVSPSAGTVGDPYNLAAALSGYLPQAGSPLIDSGLNLTSATYGPLTVGGRDFFGTTLPSGAAYDIGAGEYPPSNYSLSPAADTYVRGSVSFNTQNFGTATTFVVKGTTDLYNCRRSFLRFNLAPYSGTATSAELSLVVTGVQSGVSPTTPALVKVYAVSDDSWIESGTGGMTWNTQPAIGTLVGSVNITGTGEFPVSLTSHVNSVLSGDKVMSLSLQQDTTVDRVITFGSRETIETQRPILTLEGVSGP